MSWNPRQHDSTKGKQNVLVNNGALSCSSQHMLYSPGPKPGSKNDGLLRHSSWSICAGNRAAFFFFFFWSLFVCTVTGNTVGCIVVVVCLHCYGQHCRLHCLRNSSLIDLHHHPHLTPLPVPPAPQTPSITFGSDDDGCQSRLFSFWPQIARTSRYQTRVNTPQCGVVKQEPTT